MSRYADYDGIAPRYDAQREGSYAVWRAVLDPHVPRDGRVVDVGAGTALWAVLLREWFSARVVAVEPSAAMRDAGRGRWRGYVGGRAEALPIRSGTADSVWASTVLHHVADLDAAAREFRRVLRPGGSTLVRGAFTEHVDGVPWLEFFPAAQRLVGDRWLALARMEDAFGRAGLPLREVRSVTDLTAASWADYVTWVEVRADSVLASIDDEAFGAGLDAMRATDRPGPVYSTLQLAVFS